MRVPILGLLLPGARASITWDKPLDLASEMPIALSRTPGVLRIEDVIPSAATIYNTCGLPVPYIVVVVPKKLAMALLVAPWRDVVRYLRKQISTPSGVKYVLGKLIEFALDR